MQEVPVKCGLAHRKNNNAKQADQSSNNGNHYVKQVSQITPSLRTCFVRCLCSAKSGPHEIAFSHRTMPGEQTSPAAESDTSALSFPHSPNSVPITTNCVN